MYAYFHQDLRCKLLAVLLKFSIQKKDSGIFLNLFFAFTKVILYFDIALAFLLTNPHAGHAQASADKFVVEERKVFRFFFQT